MGSWNVIRRRELRPDRFDAEYFDVPYKRNLGILSKTGELRTLKDSFKIIDRGIKAEYNEFGTIPVLRSVNIRALNFNDIRQECVTEQYACSNRKAVTLKDDILITSTGTGTLGRTSIWAFDSQAFNVPENSFLRSPYEGVNPYFVAAFLNTKYGILQLFQNQRGSSGQLHLYPVDIARIVYPSFLLSYQEEIANEIKKSFQLREDSDRLYREAEALLNAELKLDSFTPTFKNSFSTSYKDVYFSNRFDPSHYRPEYLQLINYLQKHFKCSTINDLVCVNRRGMQPEYTKGDIKVVNSQHLAIPHIKYEELESADEFEYSRKPAAHIGKYDILIYSTGAYVGLSSVYLSSELALASNHVNILRLKKDKHLAPYYSLVLNSTVGNYWTSKYQRGSAQAELYPNEIGNFLLPVIETSTMVDISNMIIKSQELQQKASSLITKATSRIEELIEQEVSKHNNL